MMRGYILSALTGILGAILVEAVSAQTVPAGFQITNAFPTASFPDDPVQIVFLPDGRKFVAEKSGRVWVVNQTGSKLSQPFIDLSPVVLDQWDRGLLGVAIDPDYHLHPWVYFLYVVNPDSGGPDGAVPAFSRVERYQASAANPNVADLSTRQVLIGSTWPDGIPDPAVDGSHVIGTLRFGRDKTLLIGSGDAARYSNTDSGANQPGAFGPGKSPVSENIGAFRAQSLNSYCGKVLRVDKETGLGLPSNPYYDGNPASVRSKVWVYGLRNPFRLAIRPGTGSTDPNDGNPGSLYIGDVGWNTREELNVAPTGGLNFGWPHREGPADQNNYKNVTSTYYPNPNVLYNAPPNYENPAPRRNPDLYWRSNGSQSRPVGWTGNCSVGGTFYTGTSYPTRYRGAFFTADYGASWIRAVRFDANDQLILGSDTIFVSNALRPVSIETDPVSGDIFYIAYEASTGTSKIKRISFPNGNRSPVINATVSPTSGMAPLQIIANASGSTDPDNDPLTYRWYFGNGDSATTAVASYTYTTNGIYTVTAKVTDPSGASDLTIFSVVVGQTAPPGTILAPADSTVYYSDNLVPLVAAEVDTTAGSVTYRWDVDLWHDDHVHPSSYILYGKSTGFYMTIPQDGGYYRYTVRLSVTQGALTARDTTRVFPPALLQTKVLLEGPYSFAGGQMSTDLRSSGYIPTVSPYPQDARGVGSIPIGITDWVLIEFRKGPTAPAVGYRSALLRNDGRIVTDDGVKTELDVAVAPDQYYVIIRHRNHLPVMSANPVTLGAVTSTLYDFTTSSSQGYGNGAMKAVGIGTYAMFSGDVNSSGIITAADANLVFESVNASGYHARDANLSGIVTAADANMVFGNLNASSPVP